MKKKKTEVPDGFILVPIVPTEKMYQAGEETFVPCYTGTPVSSPGLVWDAMIKASENYEHTQIKENN